MIILKEMLMLKSFIQKLCVFVVLTTSLTCPIFASDYVVENQPQVIEQIIQFEQKGILKQKKNGYLYVEVSRDFVAESLPLIEAQGKIIPPGHCRTKRGIGAHISVMYENELISNDIWEIAELGQEFTFTVIELRTVKMNKRGKMQKLWLIAVDAPELEKLRENYGLSSKLHNHDFHITIGSQVPGKPQVRINDTVFEETVALEEAA